MASNAEILDDLLARLRLGRGSSVALRVVKKESDHLAIQVGANAESVVGVRVKDSLRPSFHLSFPELTAKKDGSERVAVTDFDGALFDGVAWVVGQLAEHGVVMPEMVHRKRGSAYPRTESARHRASDEPLTC
ncbi:MAG: hypothetical protein NTV51_12670 [Verrucomicrobia bacterium]|nr:hypothetical protein [Verrucomicrobiota bacterium]